MKIQPIALSKAKSATKENEKASTLSPWIAVVDALLFLAFVSALAFNGRLPILIPATYIALSAITLFVYAFDKSVAMNRRWRTEEIAKEKVGVRERLRAPSHTTFSRWC